MVIVAPRPPPPDVVKLPIEPPVVTPPPEPTPVVPPYVPPMVPPTPVITPPTVTPPTITPPPPPPPTLFSGGLNPGFIQPTPFYQTNDPAQSKFYWGGHGYQYGPTFNAQEYNQVAAPNTPFGLQQLARPLTSQEIQDIISGRGYRPSNVNPATRVNQYVPDYRTPPSYGQVRLNPMYRTTTTNTPVLPVAPDTIIP
jgi:hypothetical protein